MCADMPAQAETARDAVERALELLGVRLPSLAAVPYPVGPGAEDMVELGGATAATALRLAAAIEELCRECPDVAARIHTTAGHPAPSDR
ncbi:hypothetical protein ACFVSN_30585 [Kitasatospora sp. NPDC057904]|uniref:hypothetical protein n=1 Tax=Kitasatospora sp. NPDC057904 TaxID=3346275 RepID=UPI0036D7A4F5